MHVKVKDLNKGDVVYESGYGVTHKMEIIENVSVEVIELLGKTRHQYSVKAKNLDTGDIIDLMSTEGYEHYGPELYTEIAYV